MRKGLAVVALLAAGVCSGSAQVPCPVMLLSGTLDQGTMELTFQNQGKLPMEELSLSCAPPLRGSMKNAACHTETGIFYPGTPYTVHFSYSGAGKGRVVLSVREARLSSGASWSVRSSSGCRPLRVVAKK